MQRPRALGAPDVREKLARSGNEYVMSVELGVEAEQGVGDLQVSNYRVWR